MKCPICKETNLVMSERKGIEIDYCPDCRGIWLDRGELDKILERSHSESGQAPNQSHHQPQHRPSSHEGQSSYNDNKHGSYGHKPYKRKKSFFEELFD